MAKKIIIAGGSGFLGRLAARYFAEQQWQVVILSRKAAADAANLRYVAWNGRTAGSWTAELEGSSVLLNLSGRSVDCRYTKANMEEIFASRLESTHCLAEAVAACQQPPRLWINASSATIYQHAYEPQDEASGKIGEGFSVAVCQQWEGQFFQKPLPKTRRVALRLGIVLGRNESALVPLKRLAQLGLGGRFGPGTQYISWLHQEDYLRILQFVIDTQALEGPLNATAPHPIPNLQFLKALRTAVGMPLGLPLPVPLLEMGAVLIGTQTELILKSRCVVPRRLQEVGFRFRYPEVEGALQELTN